MEDHFDIKNLPSNFESKSQPSKIIERLYEKRKIEHDEAVVEMRIRMQEVNAQLERTILHESKTLKEDLENIKTEINDYLYSVKNDEQNEFNLEEGFFIKAIQKFTEGNNYRKRCINDFHDTLVKLEKDRSEKFKAILKETYLKTLNIAHLLPSKLEEFYEEEILAINQITLNNHQDYAEVKNNLNLQMENDMRIWTQALYEIKERFKIFLRKVARKSLDRYKTKLQQSIHVSRSENLAKEITELMRFQNELQRKLSDDQIPVNMEEVEYWIKDVQLSLAYLDQSAKNIVSLYKATIIVLFNRFFGELDEIKTMMKENGIVDKDDIEAFQCEIYTPAAEELNLHYEQELKHLQTVWGEVISYMEDVVYETYNFLKGAAHLWDYHFQRVETTQILVLVDVKNTIEKNCTAGEAFDIKLNINVDKLRQEPNLKKLDKSLIDCKNTLDEMENASIANATAEMNTVRKYQSLISAEVDVFMSEINRFLTLHPPDKENDPKMQRKRASQISLTVDSKEDLIPKQMLYCKYQVEAVKNWTFGLWEGINGYMMTGRDEIMAAADDWIKIQCEKLKDKLAVKMAFHRPRFERIKCSIYDKRLAEIELHDDRYERHKMAAETEIKALKEMQKTTSEEKYNTICQGFVTESGKIAESVNNISIKRAYDVRFLNSKIQSLGTSASARLDEESEEFLKRCDKLVDDIKISNFLFLKSVRFFSEDGNYNPEEVTKLQKDLNKLESTTVKAVAALKKDEVAKHTKYTNKLEVSKSQVNQVMKETIEEFEYNERTCNDIKKLQSDIRKEVVALKTNFKRIQTDFTDLAKKGTKNLGHHGYVEEFLENYRDLLQRVSGHMNEISHPEPVVIYFKAQSPALNNTPREIESKGSVKISADHVDKLFNHRPDYRQGYIMNLNNILLHGFEVTQRKCREFYTKHTVFHLNPTKIQPTHQSFMNEILEQFRNFLLQCEISWVDNASEFLGFLMNVLNFKEQYLYEFENKFYSSSRTYSNLVLENVITALKAAKNEIEDDYMAVHKKLKAYHGHPKNRHILNEIEKEFNNTVKVNEQKIDRILEPHTDILKEETDKIRSHYEKVRILLDELQEDQVLENFHIDLKKQLERKLELLNDMVQKEKKEDENPDTNQTIEKMVDTYMKTRTTHSLKENSLVSSLSTNTSYDKPTDNFLSEIEENLENQIETVKYFAEKELIGFSKDFQIIWSKEVATILNLYKLKYDPVAL